MFSAFNKLLSRYNTVLILQNYLYVYRLNFYLIHYSENFVNTGLWCIGYFLNSVWSKHFKYGSDGIF